MKKSRSAAEIAETILDTCTDCSVTRLVEAMTMLTAVFVCEHTATDAEGCTAIDALATRMKRCMFAGRVEDEPEELRRARCH